MRKLPDSYIPQLEALEKEIEAKYDPAIERLMVGDLFPDATLILDIDGVIRYCATSITDIAGYEPEELIGQNITVLKFMKEGAPLLLNQFLAYVNMDKEHVFGTYKNVELTSKTGEHVPVFVLVSRMVDGLELLFLIAINKGRRNEQ